ncbi:hypothetical protein TNIN_329301 [Trichonephila inaurata madagascariensis]|uniref:Uncharacterized protein n=1 Tax=Trichonephila inaurata madagascariensis TaxID=2747483 RepID=A0A8X7BRR4_9ARAC|nr:hypothetical protein TNIN_329301 [Trichonephila inaurata madagascariensis]
MVISFHTACGRDFQHRFREAIEMLVIVVADAAALKAWNKEGSSVPQHVVDAYDALLVRVLGVADDGGAGLEPRVAAILVDEAIIAAHHLTLVDHWKRRTL